MGESCLLSVHGTKQNRQCRPIIPRKGSFRFRDWHRSIPRHRCLHVFVGGAASGNKVSHGDRGEERQTTESVGVHPVLLCLSSMISVFSVAKSAPRGPGIFRKLDVPTPMGRLRIASAFFFAFSSTRSYLSVREWDKMTRAKAQRSQRKDRGITVLTGEGIIR